MASWESCRGKHQSGIKELCPAIAIKNLAEDPNIYDLQRGTCRTETGKDCDVIKRGKCVSQDEMVDNSHLIMANLLCLRQGTVGTGWIMKIGTKTVWRGWV